jgi:hypothetical protein
MVSNLDWLVWIVVPVPQQDCAATFRDHRLIGGDEIVDQLVVQQIVRGLGERDDADVAVDFVRNGCHPVSPFVDRCRHASSGFVPGHKRFAAAVFGFQHVSIFGMSIVI